VIGLSTVKKRNVQLLDESTLVSDIEIDDILDG
jgi:hypothetical protein